jgi:putative DNA primase/helicase
MDELRREMEEEAAREAEDFERWSAEQKSRRKGKGEPPAEERPPISFREITAAYMDNEEGDARLAAKLLSGRFLLDNLEGQPFRMNCTHWMPDVQREHQKAVRSVAEEYRRVANYYRTKAKEAEGTGEKEAQAKFEKLEAGYAKRSSALRTDRRTNAVWRVATAGEESLGFDGARWNQHPTLLPCANCVIDLETGKAYDARPAHELYFNLASPIEYHGLNVEAPPWDDLLGKVLCQDHDLLDYYGYFAGFASLGIQTKDLFLLYGPGGNNGKSVVTDWMSTILGGFAGTFPVELLLEEKFLSKSDAPNSTIVGLRGLRLAVFAEAQENHRFSLKAVKGYTAGGDRLKARLPYATWPVEFEQTHSLLGHTNAIPQAAGTSDQAFYDRLRLIPCRARFIAPEDGPAVPAQHIYHRRPRFQLDKDLQAVAPGILAYFVRNAMRALKLGDMPRPPSAVLAETQEYKEDQDQLGAFIRRCCLKRPPHDMRIQMKHLHEALKTWLMDEQGVPEKATWSQKRLARELKGRDGVERIESNKVFYRGILPRREWLPEEVPGLDLTRLIMLAAEEDRRAEEEAKVNDPGDVPF